MANEYLVEFRTKNARDSFLKNKEVSVLLRDEDIEEIKESNKLEFHTSLLEIPKNFNETYKSIFENLKIAYCYVKQDDNINAIYSSYGNFVYDVDEDEPIATGIFVKELEALKKKFDIKFEIADEDYDNFYDACIEFVNKDIDKSEYDVYVSMRDL